MNYYYDYGHTMFGGPSDVLWHVLGIVIAIWVISMLVRGACWGPRRMRHWHHSNWQSFSAIETLNDRFAKGEINKEEYEERKKALLS